jgi:hypothetical protein
LLSPIAIDRTLHHGKGRRVLVVVQHKVHCPRHVLPLELCIEREVDELRLALNLVRRDSEQAARLVAVLTMKFESFTQTGLPSHLTVEAPCAVSDDLAMLGYGMGMGGAGGAGVLHTSGNALVMPLLPACTTDIELTPTVTGIGSSGPAQLMCTAAPRILFVSDARLTSRVPLMTI